MPYPQPDLTQKGAVYNAFAALSGAQRALVSQPQADDLYGTWITKALNAGDYLSVLAFITAWDQSQSLLDPTINSRDTAPPYGGFSSQAAWDLRRAAGDWINQYRDTYDQIQRATMLVTGGATALEAQAAQKTLTTPTQVQAFNDSLNQGKTVADATADAIAAGLNQKPPADDAWQVTGRENGGQSPLDPRVYVVDDFPGSYTGNDSGVIPGTPGDVAGALLPGSVASPGLPTPQDFTTPAPHTDFVQTLPVIPQRKPVPAWAWIAAGVAAVVILAKQKKGA